MNGISIFIKLAPVDLKNIRRDALLAWVLVIPLEIALLIRWGIPPLTAYFERQLAFDLTPYYPLLMSSFPAMMPGMVGMVIGFLLLDERDDGIFDAMLVTPVPTWAYLGYRVSMPLALGFVMTLLTYPLAGLTPLTLRDLAAASLLGCFGAPFMALVLAGFADNKVTGFTIMKFVNAVQLAPMLAWFVPEPLQLVAGFWPSYWPVKIVWRAAAGQPYALYLVVGVVVNVIAVGLLMKRFQRVVHR